MALALHTTIILSCEAAEEQSGPTIVHSTGVGDYRVQPELIRLLQESCGNDKLSDHEKGVQCTDAPAHLLPTFQRAGFTVTSSSNAESRKIWVLTKTSEGSAEGPKDHGNENQGGDKQQPEEEEEEEEPAEE